MVKNIGIKYFSLAVFLVLCNNQCKKTDWRVGSIENMSNHTITFSMSDGYKVAQYPDTTLPVERTTAGNINPSTIGDILPKSVSWKSIYEVKAPNDTISFFIYDVDTLEKYPWELIRDKYMILRRYDLSIYDLRKLDYTLHYPPTEAMRNMKMYPAYGK